ncbi:hypothetical protein SAMD00023353_3400790 [Rosellinia necatrix]|uniref:SRR1-like domain-containing protein n=1 Tax=Rosellinia necatrix TaxID=77044 RepID=A0A1W2TL30_ROSNE|nr:hypothetical protein SAMD00023353_3400790 [Rosellinia necatrix]
MFTPEEKEILQGRNSEQKQPKDALVKRLADAFTFRRVPRGWQPPFECFKRAALTELIDTTRYELPAMSQDDLIKANEVMDYVRSKVSQSGSEMSSGVTTEELKDVLRISQSAWVKDGKDNVLAAIIDNIPNYGQIRKVVCIGLSEIAARLDPDSESITVISRGLTQHLAVMSMVRYLRTIVPHDVELFAADWIYDGPHQEALNSLGFTILDASFGKQEHFTAIDDNTMLISFSIADFESILPIISEYARPVAMIYDAYHHLVKGVRCQPFPSAVWSEVKYNDAWVTIPGPPLVTTRPPRGPDFGYPLTPMCIWHPFYTESAGNMLNDYNIAMDLFEFDVTGLTNRFELHPNTDYRLRGEADETDEKRFVGTYSRLFVRKW